MESADGQHPHACHSDRREESRDVWDGPTPDASPLRLAQHDISLGDVNTCSCSEEHKHEASRTGLSWADAVSPYGLVVMRG